MKLGPIIFTILGQSMLTKICLMGSTIVSITLGIIHGIPACGVITALFWASLILIYDRKILNACSDIASEYLDKEVPWQKYLESYPF